MYSKDETNHYMDQGTQPGVPPYYDQNQNAVPSYPFMKPPDYYQHPQNYPQQPIQPVTGYNRYPQTAIVINNYGHGGCEFCHKTTGAYVRFQPGTITFVWAAVLCFFTGCCCWIPFVCDDCQDKYIYCQNCHNVRRIEKQC